MSPAVALVLTAAASTAVPTSEAGSSFALRDRVQNVRFRLALGGEWDTNARRAVEGAEVSERSRAEEGDALVRVLVDAQGRLRIASGHRMTLSYLLGAKRFFGVTSQDLLAHELALETDHTLFSGGVLRLSARGRTHRVRDDPVRDYDLGFLRGAFGVEIGRMFYLEAAGTLSGYRYPEQPFFSYWSPTARTTLAFLPSRRWDVSASAGYAHRDYAGPGLVQTFSVDTEGNRFGPFPTFCLGDVPTEECTRKERTDDEWQLSASLSYRGPFLGRSAVLGAQYLLRLQRSTSDYENVNRHRASIFATVSLPASLTLSLLAALQLNDGTSITDTLTLAEDDENRNVVQAKLAYRISEPISVELRYALFANQFSTTDVSYLRQTVYLGFAFETGL